MKSALRHPPFAANILIRNQAFIRYPEIHWIAQALDRMKIKCGRSQAITVCRHGFGNYLPTANPGIDLRAKFSGWTQQRQLYTVKTVMTPAAKGFWGVMQPEKDFSKA